MNCQINWSLSFLIKFLLLPLIAALLFVSCGLFGSDDIKQQNYIKMTLDDEFWESGFSYGTFTLMEDALNKYFFAAGTSGGITEDTMTDFVNIRVALPVNDDATSGIFETGLERDAYFIYSTKISTEAEFEDMFNGWMILDIETMTEERFEGSFEGVLVNLADSTFTIDVSDGSFSVKIFN